MNKERSPLKHGFVAFVPNATELQKQKVLDFNIGVIEPETPTDVLSCVNSIAVSDFVLYFQDDPENAETYAEAEAFQFSFSTGIAAALAKPIHIIASKGTKQDYDRVFTVHYSIQELFEFLTEKRIVL